MDDEVIRKRSDFILNFLGMRKAFISGMIKHIIDDSGLPYRFHIPAMLYGDL